MIVTARLHRLDELMWNMTVEGIRGAHAIRMTQSSRPMLLAWSWYRARKRSAIQTPPAVTKPVLMRRVEIPVSR